MSCGHAMPNGAVVKLPGKWTLHCVRTSPPMYSGLHAPFGRMHMLITPQISESNRQSRTDCRVSAMHTNHSDKEGQPKRDDYHAQIHEN